MRSKFVMALAALSSASGALAADVLPIGTLDHQSTAGVAKADTSEDGQVAATLDFHGRSALAPSRLFFRRGQGAGESLRDAHGVGLLMGLGISKSLDLSLGLHGTYENLSTAQRDSLFPKESTYDLGWRGNFRQIAFSGVSLLLKYELMASDGFRLALAPFVESGVGDRATYSLTRSIGPKAGFMGIASYGSQGVADLSFNLGWRYRDAETVAESTLRHEVFAKALIDTYLSRTFSLFIAGEGRRLQVGDATLADKKDYQNHYESGANAGFKVALGDADLSAYMGGKLGKRDMFGYGSRQFGVALKYDFGNLDGRSKPKTNYGKKIEADQAAKARAGAKQGKQPKNFMDEVEAVFPAQGDYSEMSAQASDDVLEQASASITDDSDFKAAEQNAANNRVKDGELSEDEKVRQELEAIKAADSQAELERAALEAREEEAARKVRVKQARENEKLMKEWMDEAQKDADSMPGIGDDDMSWQGLED